MFRPPHLISASAKGAGERGVARAQTEDAAIQDQVARRQCVSRVQDRRASVEACLSTVGVVAGESGGAGVTDLEAGGGGSCAQPRRDVPADRRIARAIEDERPVAAAAICEIHRAGDHEGLAGIEVVGQGAARGAVIRPRAGEGYII